MKKSTMPPDNKKDSSEEESAPLIPVFQLK